MYTHYLSIALRNVRRAPFTAFINIFTLALGLVAFVTAYAVVGYWDNSDRHFANADRTFVITSNIALADGSTATGTWPWTNDLYERYLRVEFPEFEAIARANPWTSYLGEASVTADGRGAQVPAVAVDPEFLDIFDLPFTAGDRASALRRPDGVLLSEPAAIRLFGTTDVLGKTLTLGGNLIDATVTGVIGPIPEPSHMGNSASAVLRLELIASYALYERLVAALDTSATAPGNEGDEPEAEPAETTPQPENESWFSGYVLITYALLKRDSGLTPDTLNDRLSDFVKRHLTPEMLAFASARAGAVPVSGLMVTALDAQLLGSASDALSITTLLFGVGALVLLVACVNYANLATARATRRAREIGLRKVLGARRGQIVAQYLFEAGLLTVTALAVAVFIVNLLAPVIREATDIDLSLSLFAGTGFWSFMAALIVGVTLMAGSYPAFMLSRARPVEALRLGHMRLGSRLVSTILVGTQFVAGSLLVISVIVMAMQNTELRRTGLGTTADPYLVINNSQVTGVDSDLLRQELGRLSQVKDITQMGIAPWSNNINITTLARTREEADASQTRTAFSNAVGYDFFSTFDMPVIAGRVFERNRDDLPPEGGEPDPTTPRNIVIDRAYAAQLGFASPEQAVDELVYPPGQGPAPPVRIIGVVENRPLYLRGAGATANAYYLGFGSGADMTNQIVRLSARDVAGALSAVEEAWKRLGADSPFTYRFVDEMFEENYRDFARINQAFAGLAGFAMVIAFIGLFGMAKQTVGQRLHEIGVRKSLGAGTLQIATMLLRDFSKPVVIANLIAWPIAFIAVQAYLSIFMQRIDLTLLPFVLSLAFVLAAAWAAVASQVLHAANVNPATVLRSE